MATAIDENRLSETFAALANSTRRAILARLADGEATVNELAQPFAMTLPAISKHIRVLERAGLVVQGQRAQYRPCTLDAAPLQAVATWAERYRPVWEARFDRMDEYLTQLRSNKERRAMTDMAETQDAVVIERSFDAPIDLIWQMWTDPEHFKAWFGPDGATIPVAKMDLRVGGARSVCMEIQSHSGLMRMWFSGEFLEVVENERLVYTESMTMENGLTGGGASHPSTEVRVQLEEVNGSTKMVLTHIGVPANSPGAAGWTMALNKLATLLRSLGGR